MEWIAFSRIYPLSDDRADLRIGLLRHQIAQHCSDTDNDPSTFIPQFENQSETKDRKIATSEEQVAMVFNTLSRMMGERTEIK